MLLIAPAGRGKSALLVRWLAALEQKTLEKVFVPISIRYETNLASVTFASLAARLAIAHGEKVPSDANTPDEIWKGLVADYLRRPPPDGRSLLVVLDGLDEAANWDVTPALFPHDLPPGLRLVVSARLTADRPTAEAWLRALGWERLPTYCLSLEALDKPGVADVLQKMGVPLDQLARNIDLVAELHRLSEGDPLLVNLYVQDLWQKGDAATRLKPQDLRDIHPGYEGYFEKWWEDQRRLWGKEHPLRERTVQEVFNLLATALGPLTNDDLLTLAEPAALLNTWTLEEALRPLARFVIHTSGGYVFAHPRLGQYFYERLTPREREALEQRFLDWLRRTLEDLQTGSRSPQQVPTYLLRYGIAHLGRAKRPFTDYRPLLEGHGWAEAWHALEGSYGGYLNDVRRIWERAAEEDHQACARGEQAPHLGDELRCALIEASLHSLARRMPPQLLQALVREGLWTPAQGLVYARQMPDEGQRAQALEGLAPHLPAEWLPEALAAAREIQRDDARAQTLSALAAHLPPDLLPDTLAAAREIQDDWYRARALSALATHFPDLLPDALAAAREIQDDWYRARALSALATHFPDLLPDALAAAREIQDAGARAQALSALAARLAELPIPQAYPLWAETLPVLAGRTRKDLLRDLGALVPLITALGGEQALTETARAIQDVARWWP